MRVVPAESDVMMEFGAKEVALVPPLATVTVGKVNELTPAEKEQDIPLEHELVVVATHVGVPPERARTNPSVPAEVVAIAPVPLPRRIEFD